MNRQDPRYDKYVSILHEELKPAMGCTEPIALAYAAAKARAVLGALPERIKIEVSGNIIKNVKSVVVPHTGGLRGIPAAAAAGIIGGNEDAELEVLSNVTDDEIQRMADYLKEAEIQVVYAEPPHIFDIMITEYAGEDSAFVRIVDYHTNMVTIRHNGEVLLDKEIADQAMERKTGARGLKSIMEGVLQDLMYEIPSRPDVEKIIITKGAVTHEEEAKLIYRGEVVEDHQDDLVVTE